MTKKVTNHPQPTSTTLESRHPMTRETCIHDPWLIALLIAANLIIAIAYIWMPVSLVWIRTKVRQSNASMPFSGLNLLFVLFILACATTHLCAVLVFFRPAYYLEGFLCSIAAVVSIITAALLWRCRKPILQASKDYCSLVEKIENTNTSTVSTSTLKEVE